MDPTTYLCGPINGCTDHEANDWRSLARANLNGPTIDPMRRDYRGRELDEGITEAIVEGDIEDIKNCDVVLVSYSKPSVGTAMEVRLAKAELGKYVVIVSAADHPLSPWLLYHADAVFANYLDACKAINELERN